MSEVFIGVGGSGVGDPGRWCGRGAEVLTGGEIAVCGVCPGVGAMCDREVFQVGDQLW